MIKKSKRLISGCLVAVMMVLSVGTSVSLTNNVTTVKAGVREDNVAAHNKIEHLRWSLKRNYLGLKNVGTWQQYIKEARALTKKLPNGSTKNKYTERINSAEALVKAAGGVNHLEFSMEKNYPSVKNAEIWVTYIEKAAMDLSKVTREYEDQVINLLERLIYKAIEVDEILGGYGEDEDIDLNLDDIDVDIDSMDIQGIENLVK